MEENTAEIQARVAYTPRLLGKFQRFYLYRFWTALGAKMWLLCLLVGGCSLLLCGVLQDGISVYAWVGFALAAGLFALYLAVYGPRAQYRKQQRYLELEKRFTFSADCFTVHMEEEGLESLYLRFPYASLYRVYETRELFYLFESEVRAYLIPKASLNAAPDALAALLRRAAPRYDRSWY